MWKIDLMLKHNPHLAPAAEVLGVRNADCRPYSDKVVTELAKILFPTLTLEFETSPQPGTLRSGVTLIQWMGDIYTPIVSFLANGLNTPGLFLHEFGHACCGAARPAPDRPSPAEIAGLELLGNLDTTPGAEVAAWCGAVILAALCQIDVRIVLCDLLAGAIEPGRDDLLELFISLAERADIVTDRQELLQAVLLSPDDFCDADEMSRYRMLDAATVILLDALW